MAGLQTILQTYFYPRPPRGGRQTLVTIGIDQVVFLSTSPARGTTQRPVQSGQRRQISIHVPREGDDQLSAKITVYCKISIHVPREGDDL